MKRFSRTRLLVAAWITTAFVTLASAPPQFAMAVTSSGRQPLSEAELAGLRGGYVIANGITLDFAAEVKTYLDGILALQTTLAWTPSGAITDSVVGDAALVANADSLAAAGVNVGAILRPEDSVAVASNGATVLLQRATIDGVQNFVFNTASNQNIRQEVNIDLVLPGFEAIQQDMARGLFGLRFGDDLNVGAVDAATR